MPNRLPYAIILGLISDSYDTYNTNDRTSMPPKKIEKSNCYEVISPLRTTKFTRSTLLFILNFLSRLAR